MSIDYIVVVADDDNRLEKDVEQFSNQNYQLIGGVSICQNRNGDIVFAQAMWKTKQR